MTDASPLRGAFAALGRVLDFSGRTRRADFWPYMVLLAVIYAIGLVAMIIDSVTGSFSPISLIYGLTAILILLAFAATVRRLHDVGWSGRWMGAYVFMTLAFITSFFIWRYTLISGPHVYSQPPAYLRIMPLFMAFTMVTNGLALFIFVLCFLDGLPGPNRYGPDPKRRSAP